MTHAASCRRACPVTPCLSRIHVETLLSGWSPRPKDDKANAKHQRSPRRLSGRKVTSPAPDETSGIQQHPRRPCPSPQILLQVSRSFTSRVCAIAEDVVSPSLPWVAHLCESIRSHTSSAVVMHPSRHPTRQPTEDGITASERRPLIVTSLVRSVIALFAGEADDSAPTPVWADDDRPDRAGRNQCGPVPSGRRRKRPAHDSIAENKQRDDAGQLVAMPKQAVADQY